ncbi:MAG TPA: hypothetical protein VGL91_25095, partial [Acidobacteriota bacterium]
MNKLKPIVSSTLILFFGTLVLVDSANRNYSGTLMDKTCSSSASSPEKVAKHTKECALMESCVPDGYGIVVDGKFIKFDENGDKLASQWLAKTDKLRDLKIEVTGTMKGDVLVV